MRAPQIIMIVLFSASLLLTTKDHGKPRTGNNNFWVSLISVVIQVGILWWGGFFG
jgi:hypothetical protein